MTWVDFDTRGITPMGESAGGKSYTGGITPMGESAGGKSYTSGISRNGNAGSDTRGVRTKGANFDTRGVTLPLSQLIPLVSPQSTPFFFSGRTPSGLNSHCGVWSAFSFPRTRFLFPCGGVV